jgi:hypothetical protein
MSPQLAQSVASNRAEQCPLCPYTSDFDLLSDGKRIIDLDSEISDGTFLFLVAKQKLDRTQVAGATVDQGRLLACLPATTIKSQSSSSLELRSFMPGCGLRLPT